MKTGFVLFLAGLLVLDNAALTGCQSSQAQPDPIAEKNEYRCMPCGFDCDQKGFDAPGTCPHCGMELVKASSIRFGSLPPDSVCAYIHDHPEVVLLDVRTREEFEGSARPDYGTLKGAINLPVQELEKSSASIDSLKDRTILVYCSHSHRSPRASYLLSQRGFKHIVNLQGGMSVVGNVECKK